MKGDWYTSEKSHGGQAPHAQSSSHHSTDIGDGKTYHETEHTYANKDGNVYDSGSQSSVKDSSSKDSSKES